LDTNERLEFLGDAVLGVVVTEYLFRQFPNASEGELTEMRSSVVSQEVLAQASRDIGLGDYLYLGEGEERTGGRERESILADALEAVIGAIYLDGGIESARQVIKYLLLDHLDSILESEISRNYKSQLLEYMQARGLGSPEYAVIEEVGPDHEKEFTVEVRIQGRVMGRGKGKSKKKAEQEAAQRALERIHALH